MLNGCGAARNRKLASGNYRQRITRRRMPSRRRRDLFGNDQPADGIPRKLGMIVGMASRQSDVILTKEGSLNGTIASCRQTERRKNVDCRTDACPVKTIRRIA